MRRAFTVLALCLVKSGGRRLAVLSVSFPCPGLRLVFPKRNGVGKLSVVL